ncbi:MAG: hypothetical protein O2901_15100 [Verrucomicrobia bacterium]|nr:hypothetical protein [Verrucomicrobiota bacterium]
MKTEIKRIPVKLAGEVGVRYGSEPLSFGVPFAEGAFPAGSRLRAVRADGHELPLQTAPMATWKKDLHDVKWLLADLQADPAVDGETVFLEPVQSDPSDPSDRTDQKRSLVNITTSNGNGILTVDTGALRLKLRTDYARWRLRENTSPFAGCQIKTADGWRDVWQGAGLLLYMKDQHGNLYTSEGICPAPRIVVEEQGALRVCLLVTGHLYSPQGVRFCPYQLRIHLYAGKAHLRIFHTFVFDQDPTRIQLKAIGLKVFAKTGDGAVAAVGGEGATAHFNRNLTPDVNGYATMGAIGCDQARDCPNPANTTSGELSILQTDDLHYVARLNEQPFGAGDKAMGWASLSGSESSALAGIRDFWQEYPKGFAVSSAGIDIRIWPEDAPQPLSFLSPFDEPPIDFRGTRDEEEIKRLLAENPTAPLSLRQFGTDDVKWIEDVMARLAPGRKMSYNDFMGPFTGIGTAKTTEIVLRFAEGQTSNADAAAFGAAVQEPLVGIVDPGYLCGTDVFGRFLPAGHPQFEELDRELTAFHDRIHVRPIQRARRYGMFMHGHMINAHSPSTPDAVHNLYINSDEPEKALRYVGPFGNEAADSVQWVWSQFLRSGRRCDLRWAQLASRATADTSFVHAFPNHEENVGCIHYHGPHVWHNALNRSHSNVGGIAMDYYVTGNRRLRDVILEAADGLADNKLEPCGIVGCFAPISREFVIPVAILMEAYQITWHEKYGTPAERSLNWFLRTVRTPGLIPGHVFTRGPRGDQAEVEGQTGCPCCNDDQMWMPAMRLFPSKALTDFILAQARTHIVYDLTGDPEMAAAALGAREFVGAIRNGGNPGIYHHSACDWVPRSLKIVALAAEKDPGFWEYARKWAEEQKANPKPVPPQPPEVEGRIQLGALSTEPHPAGGDTSIG